MQIRLTSLVAIACAAVVLTSCDDGPTAVERTLSPSFANSVGPNAPANLTATPVVPDQISLAWTAKSHNETGFQIYRSSDGPTGGFYLLTTTAANVTSYADVALQPVNEHCYRVQAIAKTRVIGVSDIACARPPVRPASASNASAIPQGAVVNIAWTDNSLNESGFRIEVGGSAAGPWTTSGPSVAAGITSAQRFAAVEVEVCYLVITFNEFGDAAASNAACTTPLATPNLAATGQGQLDREIKLTWSDNLTEQWYEISRSTPGGEWQRITVVYANTTEYWDSDLSVGTQYSYRVRALKGAGFSEYSNVATATAVNGRPRAPEWGAEAYPQDGTTIDVYWEVPQAFWDGSSSITGWRIERLVPPYNDWTTAVANTTFHPQDWNWGYYGYYRDAGLTPNEWVCYRVIALSPYGESDPSYGDFSCTSPIVDYDGGFGEFSLGVSGIGPLLNRQTPLLSFGASKSAPGRAGGVNTPKGPIAQSKNRVRRAP
jgi:hypothetical protein